MKVVKETTFELGYVVWSLRPPKPSLTLVVKATFDLVHGGVARVADEQVRCTGALHHDDELEASVRSDTDYAVIKPRGECFLVGSCHPPAPAGMCAVSFAVGPIEKTLAVFGERSWGKGLRSGPTEPTPFSSMPLRWERCYGGPEVDANPVGVALPNIEDPRAPIVSPRDTPKPAGAFPIPPTWKSRKKRLGTYDAAWRATRWPWFPADFDPAFFLAAPEDQRVDGFFRGDEAVMLSNVVPGRPRIESRLPGLRARAFLDVVRHGERSFREVALALDTIILDGDGGRAIALWRGVTDVDDEKLGEVAHVFVVHEPLDARVDVASHRARFESMLREDAAAVAPPAPPEALAPDPPRPPPPEPGAEVATAVAKARADLAAKGIDMDAELAPTPAPLDPAVLDQVRDQLLAAYAAAGEEPPPEVSELRAPAVKPRETPPGKADLRALVVAKLARGEALAGVDLSGADLSNLDFAGVDLGGAILKGASLRGARLDAAKLGRAVLAGADLEGASAVAAVFREADLTGASAPSVSFEGAVLEGATLARCKLAGARFTKAMAAGAQFEGADLAGAVFDDARLEKADFTGADLGAVSFVRAALVDATLYGTKAARVNFDGADLTKLRASDGAVLTEASIRDVRAAGSRWGGSDLSRAHFARADLERADFSGAVLDDARLDGCELRAARFPGAKLRGARLRRSNAFEANFEAADLSRADLSGSSLFGAQLWRAKTDGATLEGADVQRTHLA